MSGEPTTPLPWKFSPWHIEEGPSAVRAPNGDIVCTTSSDADAKRIVSSVNALPALLSALEEIANSDRVSSLQSDPAKNPRHIALEAIASYRSKQI